MKAQPIQDHRTEATIENVRNRISVIEDLNERGVGTALWHQQFELACLRMLLAGMDSEPVAFIVKSPLGHVAYRTISADDAEYIKRKGYTCEPLYAAPPAPVSVPDEMEMDDDFDSAFEHGKAVGWNACRAAMLAPGVMYDPRTATTGSATMQTSDVLSEIIELYDTDPGFAEHMGVELANKCREVLGQK